MSSEEVDSDEMDELYAQADQSFAFLMELVKGANAEAASAVWTTMHEYAKCKGDYNLEIIFLFDNLQRQHHNSIPYILE